MTDEESVTSLLGVANAGFRLSLLLNAVASQIASSGIEIHSISKGVSLFSLALKHVGRALQATDSVHAPNALDEAKKIADQGFMTLNEIEDMLDQLKASENLTNTHGLSIQQRVKWCFKKHRVTYLLAQLECLKLSLTVMLQVLQLGKLIEAKRKEYGSNIDDEIAQERADTQNMIIVRYWSLRRLDRLRNLAEQEAKEAENDKMNLLIGSDTPVRRNSSPFQESDTRSKTGGPVKVHVVSLRELDASMGAIHESPKGMIGCSDWVISSLLQSWTRISEVQGGSFQTVPDIQMNNPTIDSESDDDHHSEFDGHETKGYYLEGTTDDWRKPHSQQAREHAAQLRKKYSNYQAHVDSDSESSVSSDHSSERKTQGDTITSTENKTQPKDIKKKTGLHNPNTREPVSDHGYSTSGSSYHESRPPRRPHHYPQPPSKPPHRQYYHHGPQGRPSPHPMPLSPTPQAPRQPFHPRSSPPMEPHHHYPHRSPHHSRSRDSRNKHVRIQSPHDSGRDERKDRHKHMKRSSTRGVLGISALAGFMDALEAFHII